MSYDIFFVDSLDGNQAFRGHIVVFSGQVKTGMRRRELRKGHEGDPLITLTRSCTDLLTSHPY